MNDSQLRDLDDIRRSIGRYFWALDDHDWPAVGQCFTDDVSAIYDGVVLAGGRQALEKALASGTPGITAGIEELKLWTHFVGLSRIDLNGDIASAETPAIAHIVHTRGGQQRMLIRSLRYLDVLVRTADGWKIAEREHTCDWVREESVISATDFGSRRRYREIAY